MEKIMMNLKTKMMKVDNIYQPYKKWRIKQVTKKRVNAVHSIGYFELNKICELLTQKEVKVFCAFGTLLGIIRNNSFIDSDSDIDMGILNGDMTTWKIIEIVLEDLGFHLDHQYKIGNKIIEQNYLKDFLSIDFFLYEIDVDKLVAHVPFKDEHIEYPSENHYSVMDRFSPQFTITRKEFHNGLVFIPDEPEKYLEMVYGIKWRVPDPDYRYENEKNKKDGVFCMIEFPNKPT